MNAIEQSLFKTRKSILDVFAEFGLQYSSEVEIRLKECTSCGIWLKTMKKDLDGHEICYYCYETYGT